MIRTFINEHCTRHVYGLIQLRDFAKRFKATLSKSEQKRWPYRRIQVELERQNIPTGTMDRRLWIGGLLLNPRPEEVNCWSVRDGQLRRERVTGVLREPAA